MKKLSKKELNKKIDTFLQVKFAKYPELGDEEPVRHSHVETFLSRALQTF